MAEASDKPEANFLRRWSQRKLAAAREVEAPAPAAVPPVASSPVAAPVTTGQPPQEPPAETALPDVASLTFESDFKPFLAADVDEGTRRAALRKLFADPHFNTMDGLDVYIDDYSKFEPITPEVLKQLQHVRYLFDPPKTRVNEHGHVEDIVDAPEAKGQGDAPAAADQAALSDAAASTQEAPVPADSTLASLPSPVPAAPEAER
jgi:hypothetical protein